MPCPPGVTVFNAGEHPITVEGITLDGWEPTNPDHKLARDIDPGEQAMLRTELSTDCSVPQPRTAPEAVLDVRTVDGTQRSIEVPITQWTTLTQAREWVCSADYGYPEVWAELGEPVWAEGSLTLAMHFQSGGEVTVVGLESLNPAFTVETTELPATTSDVNARSIETVWRVADCVLAREFEQSGVAVRLTLDDDTTHEVDVSYGTGFGSLVRLAERSCPAP